MVPHDLSDEPVVGVVELNRIVMFSVMILASRSARVVVAALNLAKIA